MKLEKCAIVGSGKPGSVNLGMNNPDGELIVDGLISAHAETHFDIQRAKRVSAKSVLTVDANKEQREAEQQEAEQPKPEQRRKYFQGWRPSE